MDSARLETSFEHRRPITGRQKLRTAIAFVAIWSISLLVLLFGLPIIIYQTIARHPESR